MWFAQLRLLQRLLGLFVLVCPHHQRVPVPSGPREPGGPADPAGREGREQGLDGEWRGRSQHRAPGGFWGLPPSSCPARIWVPCGARGYAGRGCLGTPFRGSRPPLCPWGAQPQRPAAGLPRQPPDPAVCGAGGRGGPAACPRPGHRSPASPCCCPSGCSLRIWSDPTITLRDPVAAGVSVRARGAAAGHSRVLSAPGALRWVLVRRGGPDCTVWVGVRSGQSPGCVWIFLGWQLPCPAFVQAARCGQSLPLSPEKATRARPPRGPAASRRGGEAAGQHLLCPAAVPCPLRPPCPLCGCWGLMQMAAGEGTPSFQGGK